MTMTDNLNHQSGPTGPNHFTLKGKKAEEILHVLARETFIQDWCFESPKYKHGSNEKELCDLLILFGDIAIIWQIKDIQYKGNVERYIRKAVKGNLNQIYGAEKVILEGKIPITVGNSRRQNIPIDMATIKNIYRIAAPMDRNSVSFQNLIGEEGRPVHVFSRQFLEVALSELDTISDFCQYLTAKEAELSPHSEKTNECEEDLLAEYVLQGRSFNSVFKNWLGKSMKGNWVKTKTNSQYVLKKEAEEVSYAWDHIINDVHRSQHDDYEFIARVLAEPNRFIRRNLAEKFIEAHKESGTTEYAEAVFTRYLAINNYGVVFMFPDENMSEENRLTLLSHKCCKQYIQLPQWPRAVVGISYDKPNSKKGYTFQYVLMANIPESSRKDIQNDVEANEKDLERLFPKTTFRSSEFHTKEFPDTP